MSIRWNSFLCLRVASMLPSTLLSPSLFVILSTVDYAAGTFPLITDYVIFCTCYGFYPPRLPKLQRKL